MFEKFCSDFLEYIGIAIVIATLAVSCEFCFREDRTQGPTQWFGCCKTDK